MLNKRVQILFNEDDYVGLAEIARGEDTSVGELVRKAVKKEYFPDRERELALRKKTYDGVMELRKIIGVSKSKIDYKELINYGRKW
jgi:hypothetical protein